MSPRILLVDDHAALRRGLEEILADAFQGSSFGHAGDEHQAMDKVKAGSWDVIVLDLNLPGRGGLEMIGSFKDEQPHAKILVYTAFSEQQVGIRAIRAGADGFLSKDSPPEQVPEAINKLLRGNQYVSPELLALLISGARGETGPKHAALSDRELQILRMLASGMPLARIAEELSLSSKTVTTYRTRVLEKLELTTNADLVRYALAHGIIK